MDIVKDFVVRSFVRSFGGRAVAVGRRRKRRRKFSFFLFFCIQNTQSWRLYQGSTALRLSHAMAVAAIPPT